MNTSSTTRSASRRFRAAAAISVAVVAAVAVACSDSERPTAPSARASTAEGTAAQAAKASGGGTRSYGILAHGRVHASTGSPPILWAGRNVLSVSRKQTGLYCVELPADVDFDVALVNPYPTGQTSFSQASGTCDPLPHAMPVFTRDVTGTPSDDVSFVFIIP